MSKKQLKTLKAVKNVIPLSPNHGFNEQEIADISRVLLQWFAVNQRQLPWRNLPNTMDVNQKAYFIWVSEIMLQQTQVVTVIKYFNKWTEKWPTLKSLADETKLEEVNQIWSGLGYYSRARRLLEGAKKVLNDYKGQVPQNAKALQQLPGVGRYTACAIASTAFNENVGVLDGNVIRVLTRLRAIGADVKTSTVISHLWSLADAIVDHDQPGDFNQAMMELGATVCMPKRPSCGSCPLRTVCRAYKHVSSKQPHTVDKSNSKNQIVDIESCVKDCGLCFSKGESWDASLGVMNYPRTAKKVSVRRQQSVVCVIHRDKDSTREFFMVQRPPKGLLADLWEFPSAVLIPDDDEDEQDAAKFLDRMLSTEYSISEKLIKKKTVVGEVVHIFSHIHQTYIVEGLLCSSSSALSTPSHYQAGKWFSREMLENAAISTAMKKVLKTFENKNGGLNRKRKYQAASSLQPRKKQIKVTDYFKP